MAKYICKISRRAGKKKSVVVTAKSPSHAILKATSFGSKTRHRFAPFAVAILRKYASCRRVKGK